MTTIITVFEKIHRNGMNVSVFEMSKDMLHLQHNTATKTIRQTCATKYYQNPLCGSFRFILLQMCAEHKTWAHDVFDTAIELYSNLTC